MWFSIYYLLYSPPQQGAPTEAVSSGLPMLVNINVFKGMSTIAIPVYEHNKHLNSQINQFITQ
jgi:hypothetical protein